MQLLCLLYEEGWVCVEEIISGLKGGLMFT